MTMPFDYNAAYGNLKPGMMGGAAPSSIPQYAQNALQSQNGGGGLGSLFSGGGGLQSILGGIFDIFNSPDRAAMDKYKDYFNQATAFQNPFYGAGVGAVGDYQKWLQGMSDPSKFINETMGKYESSPWSNFLQKQASNAATNQASASGLAGSTPLTQYAQQNAKDIASEDMSKWLQNVLGINTQYGGGLKNLISGGQHSADILSQLFGGGASDMANMAYNRAGQRNQDWSNILSGIGGLFF